MRSKCTEYIVMECGLSYAVVMDKDGHFLKVPNMGYKVGQTISRVYVPERFAAVIDHRRRMRIFAGVAACLLALMLGAWIMWSRPAGTVRMQINPDVLMEVNRFDRVVGIDGLNGDGLHLISGVSVYGETVTEASDILTDRAIEMGYLKDGGVIRLTADSKKDRWKTVMEDMLVAEIKEHLSEYDITVTAEDNYYTDNIGNGTDTTEVTVSETEKNDPSVTSGPEITVEPPVTESPETAAPVVTEKPPVTSYDDDDDDDDPDETDDDDDSDDDPDDEDDD